MNFYNRGFSILKEAIAVDESHEYQKALGLYILGIDHLVTGLKHDKAQYNKNIVRQRIVEFLERAEYIKEALSEKHQKKDKNKSNQSSSESKNPDRERLRKALEEVVVSEKPSVEWEDVIGMNNAKKTLNEAVVLPRQYPQLFTGKRKAWRTLLLYGPPGTGKSYLAKALASNIDSTFISASSSDLISKWSGESEKLIRELFSLAKERQPSIIFVDEIDAICSQRSDDDTDSLRRIKNEFLIHLQNVTDDPDNNVVVLAATNRPWDLDPALRRRFDKRIYIPLPEAEDRLNILRVHLGKEESTRFPLRDLERLTYSEEGSNMYSGSDLSVVARDALMQPVRRAMKSQYFKTIETEDGEKTIPCDRHDSNAFRSSLFNLKHPENLMVPPVTLEDLRSAFTRVKPSVNEKDLEQFDSWTAKYGEQGMMNAAEEEAEVKRLRERIGMNSNNMNSDSDHYQNNENYANENNSDDNIDVSSEDEDENNHANDRYHRHNNNKNNNNNNKKWDSLVLDMIKIN
eukprot:gb/GECH01009565.1/.p1 GENE.gb/GECH01009565.1/~~gb/GECH01009565.1/.p1  ORF type:complete len:516 (+),score=156.51 gb/GECH01009565.1/:1-1548(+)